ncbi:hypothetical protein diail_6652 [Diaporthe ilicicola]|nr:hypothetical protein diail_6652 [Diaporthe ilicicola]
MPANVKAPGEYSTNPHTIKARRRKMGLTGAKKVEDDGRTADDKALRHACNVVKLKPEYVRASESEKKAMMDQAMRDTMEKRRARGQDTISKMAAFNAGAYRNRDGAAGPKTRAAIPAFLVDNGWVPPRPNGAPQPSATSGRSDNGAANRDSLTPMSLGSAPASDVAGVGSTFAGANGLPFSANGHNSQATPSIMRPDRYDLRPVGRPIQSNGKFPGSQTPLPSFDDFKASATPAAFANMTSEPMLASIEEDDPTTVEDDSTAKVKAEMAQLRSFYENRLASNNNDNNLDLRSVEAKVDMEKGRVTDLGVRVNQLEGIVHDLQNVGLKDIACRVAELESIVEGLRGKVGGGCDVEVAKMREVMGGLKGALDKVGGFV